MTNTTQDRQKALDYLDDMTGVRELEIPGGRSPVMFIARHEKTIRAALQSPDPAPLVKALEKIAEGFDTQSMRSYAVEALAAHKASNNKNTEGN